MERELCEYLFRCSAKSDSVVVHALCFAARVWKDLALWTKAASPEEDPLTKVGHEELVEAAILFGWDNVVLV